MGSTWSRGTQTPLGTGDLMGLQGESTEGEDCLPSIPLLPSSFLGLKGFLQQKFPGEEEGLSPHSPCPSPQAATWP